jgi:hypothetical protein
MPPSPSTPPSTTTLLPASTPFRTCNATSNSFDPKYEGRETLYGHLSNEMSPYFVGPMPPQEFLDSFLPLSTPDTSAESVPTFKVGMFSSLTKLTSEADMYDRFVSSNLCVPPCPSNSPLDRQCCIIYPELDSGQHITPDRQGPL